MKKPKLPIISIDFDGVIYIDHKLAPLARESIQELADRGYQIVIHTLRAKTMHSRVWVEEWLNERDIPFHKVTNEKPDAILFIDDKALQFTNWYEAMHMIELRDTLMMVE